MMIFLSSLFKFRNAFGRRWFGSLGSLKKHSPNVSALLLKPLETYLQLNKSVEIILHFSTGGKCAMGAAGSLGRRVLGGT